jgi:hypothetical protein
MAFSVTFSGHEVREYDNRARFVIADNGVLVIEDGAETMHYSPHVWHEVRSTEPPQRGPSLDPAVRRPAEPD